MRANQNHCLSEFQSSLYSSALPDSFFNMCFINLLSLGLNQSFFTMVYPYHKHIISIADYSCYSITTSIPVVYAKHSAWTWIQFKHNILLSDHTAQQQTQQT